MNDHILESEINLNNTKNDESSSFINLAVKEKENSGFVVVLGNETNQYQNQMKN